MLPGIGTLDLTDAKTPPQAADWSLSLNAADLRMIGENSAFIVRIEWNDVPPPDPLQDPAITGYIEVNVANSTVQVKSNDSAVGSAQTLPSKLFDLRIELTGTTLHVTIAPRQYFFTPETRTAPTVISGNLGTPRGAEEG